MLTINRVICLTNLDRPAEALPDVRRLLALPADKDGRGPMNAHFETLALAALHAGDVTLGADWSSVPAACSPAPPCPTSAPRCAWPRPSC